MLREKMTESRVISRMDLATSDISTSTHSKVAGGKPILNIKEVSKKFGGLQALSQVSFDVREGQLKALIGPNGAGKSTLLNLISRFITPDRGEIIFLGHNMATYPAHQISRLGLGRTFQMVQFMGEISVIKSVMVGVHALTQKGFLSGILKTPSQRAEERAIRSAAHEALEIVGIQSLAEKPMNVLTYADQKRAELARALAGKPKILLVDEPAGSLNRIEAEELGNLLRQINKMGITIVIVEHNMPLVMSISDEIVVLNYGKKIAEGTPREIANDPSVVDAYLGKED
jgi:branched-chain amino acid transport system ATP-binding protein